MMNSSQNTVCFKALSTSLVLLAATAALVGCAGDDEPATNSAANALAHVAVEGAGVNCPAGGQAIQLGVDENRNGQLDANEVQSTSFVCNGAAGAPGASGADGQDGADGHDGQDGAQGDQGIDGPQGPQGDAGAQGPGVAEPSLGRFLPSQTVKGAVVTCASTTTTDPITTCTGLKVNGVPVYLGPKEANVICNVVSGKGYQSANGYGVTSGPYLLWSGAAWSLSTGAASPMDNLTCNR